MAHAVKRNSIGEWSGWDYLPGIAFIVIGALALLVTPLASLATGMYLGAMLCVAGGFGLLGGIAHIKQRGAWLAALLGLFSLVVGVTVLYNPLAGAVSLVWVIGAWFIVGGLLELATAASVRFGKGWLLLVGLVDLALGAIMVMMKPTEAFLFLGYFVGISLVFRGLWTVLFVGEVHELGRKVDYAMA